MLIAVTDAKAQLTELVRLAEQGNEIILTRHGRPAVTLVPLRPPVNLDARKRVLDEIMVSAAGNAAPDPSAARSQDFLYDKDGLPG